MNHKAHRLRWALFFDCSSELNSDLTLDYTQSSFSGTDINDFLQSVLERLYPLTPYQMLPLMTSMTSQNGNVICASRYDNTVYKLIDGSSNVISECPELYAQNDYVGFEFTTTKYLTQLKVTTKGTSGATSIGYLQYSSDGNNWVNATSFNIPASGDTNEYTHTASDINQNVKAVRVAKLASGGGFKAYKLEAYGY